MSKRALGAIVIVLLGSALVFAQQARVLNLRGDRFKPLTWEQLTPEQKTMVDDLLAGTRTSLNGPFNVTLRSPEMGNIAQKLGEYLRFHTSVPTRLNEMAIRPPSRGHLNTSGTHTSRSPSRRGCQRLSLTIFRLVVDRRGCGQTRRSSTTSRLSSEAGAVSPMPRFRRL